MASKAFLILLSFIVFSQNYAIPLDASNPLSTTTDIVIVTAVVTSSVEVLETSTVLLSPYPSPSSTTETNVTPSSATTSPSPTTPPSPAIVTDVVTVTDIVTPPPVTVTVIDPTTTVEVITTTVAPSSTDTPSSGTAWTAPAQMTDLSCFKVSEFAYGQNNMQIVQGIPPEASATSASSLAVASAVLSALSFEAATAPQAPPTWDNSSSVIQLFYPAGSVNPTTEPQGGADFYAAPLDISSAQNITMAYSVFFPADFDWVLAGKLPGIYGGHKTCSGGDDALSCFSTRLMWREGGMGELYLVGILSISTSSLLKTII